MQLSYYKFSAEFNAERIFENYSSLLLQEIQIGLGFTFLVLAHLGSPRQNPESCKTVIVVVVFSIW